jgi:hypothetical protein
MNSELEGVWKKGMVALFKVPSRNLPGGTKKTTKNPSQDILSPRRDLNHVPSDSEAAVPTTRPLCSELLMLVTVIMCVDLLIPEDSISASLQIIKVVQQRAR